MAMEDAVASARARDAAAATSRKPSGDYQKMRLVRASRVQISADSLVGQIFHVPDGVERAGAQRHLSRAARPSATTTRSSGCSRRPTTCGNSRREQVGADLGHRAHAAKLHRALRARSTRISSARRAPGSPPAIAPKSVARPVSTACAPSARAFRMSTPRRTPPSSKTVMLGSDRAAQFRVKRPASARRRRAGARRGSRPRRRRSRPRPRARHRRRARRPSAAACPATARAGA